MKKLIDDAIRKIMPKLIRAMEHHSGLKVRGLMAQTPGTTDEHVLWQFRKKARDRKPVLTVSYRYEPRDRVGSLQVDLTDGNATPRLLKTLEVVFRSYLLGVVFKASVPNQSHGALGYVNEAAINAAVERFFGVSRAPSQAPRKRAAQKDQPKTD